MTWLTRHRIPPVVSKGYKAKGAYQTINGLKTCEWNDDNAPGDQVEERKKPRELTSLCRCHRPRVGHQGHPGGVW
jgi:hypothetical protein